MKLARPVFAALVALLALIFLASPAAAQTWTALGPPGGEFPRVFVAPSQPTTLFAMPSGDTGGLFKSSNSGDSWLSISTNMTAGTCDIHVTDLAIHPTQPNTIFAATRALGVCKSTDGGTTWTQSIAGLPNDANQYQRPVLSIAINPQTPTVLFAGTEAGVYVSVNSGSTWALSGAVNQSGASNQPILSVAFAPSAANTAYAYIRGTVYKTSDGGTTWAPTANLSPSTAKDGLLTVSPASPNTVLLVVEDNVYRTTTGAASWAVSTSGAAGAFFYGNVSIDPTNTNTMFLTAVGSCGLCKSTDGGATWTAVAATGLPSGFGATNVVQTTSIDPTNPSRMFAGTPFGAYRSTNNGVTWASISTGLNGQSIGAMALGGDSPASVYIGVPGSTDAADVLKLSGGALPFANLGSSVSNGSLRDLVVDPINASNLYAVGGKNCAQVYKSTNGGTSWVAINPSTVPSSLCAGALVIDPTTPATLYLGVSSQTGGTQSAVVYKTTNGGSSWTSVSTGLSFSVQRIAISKRTPAILYAGSASQVFKTTNGGGSWSSAGSGLPSVSNSSGGGRIAIDPTDDNIVYFATIQGVYGTTNGGTSWTAKRGGWPTIQGNFFGANALAIDPGTPTTLYASTSTPSPGPASSFLGMSALGTGLYKSTDSGATWTVASNTLAGVNVSNVLFDGTRIYAATNNGVFKFAVVTTPTVTLDRTALSFAAVGTPAAFSSQTGPQTVRMRQTGGTATWTATSNNAWLTVTPASGSGSATLTIAVKPDSSVPSSGSTTGTITIALTGALNTAGPITVTLTIVPTTAAPSPAFGVFDTPAGDATVLAGSIAVTGWTLDNIGVRRVEIWRDLQAGETTPPNPGGPGDPRTGKVLITDNVLFVDGARPDVETLNPTTPTNYRAGWGYLLLTWGLWNQGNGTYKLHAYAFDLENNFSTIGSKTIVVSNNTATKPFGSIDHPSIGGDPSVGQQFPNLGWGLTPKVNGAATCKIQSNGVQVSIDSGPLQSVAYGELRSDIAGAFIGFSNSSGAGGRSAIDWTTLANGSHTIGWLITDDCNRADGVGSRFFTISSGTSLLAADTASPIAEPASLFAASRASETESADPITVARGYGELPEIVDPATTGSRTVEMKQGERIEIRVPRGFESAYQLGPGGQRRALPIGSTWDAGSDTFYWQPAPGFLGRFRIVFTNGSERISVRVVITP